MDHETDILLVSMYIFVLGLGMGLLMQNLVLAVQNTVRVAEVGSASASVAFFRTVGGAVGVSVLGAVMSSSVSSRAAEGMRAANIPVADGGTGDTLDIAALPDAVQGIFRAAYGDATATIFQISAVISVIALIAVLCIKEKVLRRTLDIQPTAKMPLEPALTAGSEMMPASAAGEPPVGDTPGRSSGSRSSGSSSRSSG